MAGMDPWDARTLEWAIPNPTPASNFAVVPMVHGLDEFWHQKYDEDKTGRPVRREDAEAHDRTAATRSAPIPPSRSICRVRPTSRSSWPPVFP